MLQHHADGTLAISGETWIDFLWLYPLRKKASSKTVAVHRVSAAQVIATATPCKPLLVCPRQT